MRLQAKEEKYEFDAAFYALAAGAIILVVGSFWIGKRMVDRYHGREVQELVTKANLNTLEAYKPHAKAWVAPLARQYHLNPDEVKKAETLFQQAFFERMRVWTDDRMAGVPMEQTRKKQDAEWARYMNQFTEMAAKRK
jgi:hypothetical protein